MKPRYLPADPLAGYRAAAADIDAAVKRVLQSGTYILGPESESFEREFAAYLGVGACAGVARGTYLFALPGSTGAVKDGWDGILKYQLDIRHRPCNFVEIMPRLEEHRK